MANLRNSPKSVNGNQSWTVGKYMPFVKIGQKGRWFKVADLEGQKHWIYSPLLTQKFRCLVVRSSRANIRSGPGKGFPLAAYRTAYKYEAFKRSEKKGNWYKISDQFGQVGWLHASTVWLPTKRFRYKFK